MDLSIIIPCYNEAENVPKIQKEFFPVASELAKDRSLEVIFVDDGSTDGTWQRLVDAFGNGNEPGVTVKFERHEVNQGLGAAVRTGFDAARGEVIVTTDSDGTYKFSEIPNLLFYLRPGVDMVTASPYHPAGAVAGVSASARRMRSSFRSGVMTSSQWPWQRLPRLCSPPLSPGRWSI